MNATTPDVQFTMYGPGRFPEGSGIAANGYLFTVPGSFPEDTHPHTNVTNQEMAIYRTADGWEVRDANGQRRVWSTGPSRRTAVDSAFAVIAHERRQRAAEIAERRVHILGLAEVPPYAVEVTDSVSLVLTPNRIGVLQTTSRAAHVMLDARTGASVTVPPGDTAIVRTTLVGVLHARCGCEPTQAAWFENETDARLHADAVTVCWPCEKNPT